MSPRPSDVLLRTQTDERLAALARDGHQRAFTLLVERYADGLRRVASRLAFEPQRADDIVQQALMEAWASLRNGAEVRHVRGWLYQIVRNAAYTDARHGPSPADELSSELPDPQSSASAVDARLLARTVIGLIAELPDQQRAALVQTELQGRTRHEIAVDLGLSDGAVRQLVHRARGALRVSATALTPYPLAAWLARDHGGHVLAERITQLSASTTGSGTARAGAGAGIAGSAAGGGLLLKGGAVVIATAGALGGGLVLHGAQHPTRSLSHRVRAVAIAAAQPPASQRSVTPSSRIVAADHVQLHDRVNHSTDRPLPKVGSDHRSSPGDQTLTDAAQPSAAPSDGAPSDGAPTATTASDLSRQDGATPQPNQTEPTTDPSASPLGPVTPTEVPASATLGSDTPSVSPDTASPETG